jgi:GT2 family glycosyltransferase
MKNLDYQETLLVSILIFSGTDSVNNLLHTLPEHLSAVAADCSLAVKVRIRKNNPALNTVQLEDHIRECNTIYHPISFEILDDGQNSGFGRGHNLNFLSSPADYVLILNDDLDFPGLDWMNIAITRMRSQKDLALVGDISNPSSINPSFANGTFPDDHRSYSLRYAEASILLVKGAAFEVIGMFDESIAWAMGEDSDLSFKAQQMGYAIDWMSIPHRHFRSTSFNSLPPYQKSSILEHNRARLFAKWGASLESGSIGKFEVFDLYSDGLGDMLCALLHVRAEYERLPSSLHENIIVNVGSVDLGRLVLPSHARITSMRNIDLLKDTLRPDEAISVRSIRQTNYALPFNIHPLIAGSLSLPLCDDDTLSKIAASFAEGLPEVLNGRSYAVVHLEFARSGHHGRGPSLRTMQRIMSLLHELDCDIVVVGKSDTVPIDYFASESRQVFDLQGKLELPNLISTVANAKYFVGIDSFPFHIAQVANIKSSVFFGSVNPLTRLLSENSVWPIVATLDCIGCYHDQIQPGAPFCMRMNDQCTDDLTSEDIAASIRAMRDNSRYDWTVLRKLLERKQAKLIEYIKFHPAPTKRLFSSALSNQKVSELIYEFTERVASLHGQQAEHALVSQLKSENKRMRTELLDAHTRIASFTVRNAPPARSDEGLKLIAGTDAIFRQVDCSLLFEGDEIVCSSNSIDPWIEFKPFVLQGSRLGASITASASPQTILRIYWRYASQGFAEERSVAYDIGEFSSSRTWWFSGDASLPIYVRIDPTDKAGQVRMKLNFFGDLDVDAMASARFNTPTAKRKSRLGTILGRHDV